MTDTSARVLIEVKIKRRFLILANQRKMTKSKNIENYILLNTQYLVNDKERKVEKVASCFKMFKLCREMV